MPSHGLRALACSEWMTAEWREQVLTGSLVLCVCVYACVSASDMGSQANWVTDGPKADLRHPPSSRPAPPALASDGDGPRISKERQSQHSHQLKILPLRPQLQYHHLWLCNRRTRNREGGAETLVREKKGKNERMP